MIGPWESFVDFKFFIETDFGYVYEKDFASLRIGVRDNNSDYEVGTLKSLIAYNDSSQNIFFKKCGLIINGIETYGKPVVFIDPGECAWAGVKRLDCLDIDRRFRVIEDQRTDGHTEEVVRFHRSDLQTVLYNGKNALLVGFLSQNHGANKIDIFPSSDTKTVEKIEAWQEIGISLAPGNEYMLDDIIIAKDSSPYLLLENYADLVQKHHSRIFDEKPITGMMTWYGYHASITEEAVLENARIIKDFFSGYPQENEIYMLLDHGWQSEAEWGTLDNDDERFPHGIEWLADRLKDIGVRFGIWHTPFCITEFSTDYENLKPMMARDETGNPYEGTASVWSSYEHEDRGARRKLNYLDGAMTSVRDRWEHEMHTFRKWGAAYCKMDFFALIKGSETGKNIARGELYQNCWESFRRGFGADNHIAPCSCDTNMQLGYCDSIRIASDIGEAGTWPGADEGYKFGHSTIAAMWYKNRKFWVNDADSIQVGKGCSMGEARIRATTVALSGGHVMLSEDLRTISADRLEMVKRILPPLKKSARPVNLFENPFPDGYPSIWCLDIERETGSQKTVALFNFDRSSMEFMLNPELLGIPDDMEYIALEWWEGKWLGRFTSNMKITVSSEDCAVIHAIQIGKNPEIISISHHISGGYILNNIRFNENTGELSGYITTKQGLKTVMYGYAPYDWIIPISMRSHVIKNRIGGWQMEIETTGQITPFTIKFKHKDLL